MSVIDIKHACAFTGHRPERLEAPEEQRKPLTTRLRRNWKWKGLKDDG